MKQRRYKSDYRLEDRTPVYQGKWYIAPRRSALPLGAITLMVWALAFLYLKTGAGTTRFMPALLPALIALIPLFYQSMGVAALARLPKRATRGQVENSAGRTVRGALGACVFLLMGSVGCGIYCFINRAWSAEWYSCALLLAAGALNVWVFQKARGRYREIRAAE
ncbi:MAG: hypothetical protein IJ074_08160 [Clostridia bacterium]|nr:hypothetical protein [Clostridia bacterium]